MCRLDCPKMASGAARAAHAARAPRNRLRKARNRRCSASPLRRHAPIVTYPRHAARLPARGAPSASAPLWPCTTSEASGARKSEHTQTMSERACHASVGTAYVTRACKPSCLPVLSTCGGGSSTAEATARSRREASAKELAAIERHPIPRAPDHEARIMDEEAARRRRARRSVGSTAQALPSTWTSRISQGDRDSCDQMRSETTYFWAGLPK